MPKKAASAKSQRPPRPLVVSEAPFRPAPPASNEWPGAHTTEHLYPVPMPFTRLIGRERDIDELSHLLSQPEVRLVTLSGVAGIGKTRLAWQIINELQAAFPAGCHFVPLAAISTVEFVVPTIIQSLGLPRAENRSPFEHLVALLHQQHLLLVLDNFEQLVVGANVLMDLLAACPGLKLLVTSRALLRIQGEYEFRVQPLALPDLTQLPDWEQLGCYAAIALFVERAQAAKHSFQLSEANACAVAEICARLDGLPLAIELAAARMKVLSLADLLVRLEHRLHVLTGGGADLPKRQQTLRATISWSYDLLSAEEQWLFRHLAVFVGGGSLEAIEGVCALLKGPSPQVLDALIALLDHSLLARREESGEKIRFFLFETLREYGLERLEAEGEIEQARQVHATYYAALAQQEPPLFTLPPADWLDRIEREYGNVRSTLEWLLEQQEAEAALRLAGTLGGFWFFRGHLSEGRQFLIRALATRSSASQATVSKLARAQALQMVGWLALWQLDYLRAEQYLREGLQLFEELNDSAGRAALLNLLSVVEATRGNLALAAKMSEEALTRCQELGEQRGVADVLLMRGMLALFRGDFAVAQHCCTQSLAIFESLDDSWGVAANLHYLGWTFYCRGDALTARRHTEDSVARFRTCGIPSLTAEALTMLGYEILAQGEAARVAALFEEALLLGRAVGNPVTIARVLCGLGHLAWRQREESNACEYFENSIRCLKGMEHFARARWIVASCLEGMAEIAWAEGKAAWSVRLFSAAIARCTLENPATFLTALHPNYAETLEAAGNRWKKGAFAQLWAEGYAMTLEQVLGKEGQARLGKRAKQLPPSASPIQPPLVISHELTARELEVLTLITEGLKNKAMAERLTLSPHTINIHVQAVYRKLKVSSRAEAMRRAFEHGLVKRITPEA